MKTDEQEKVLSKFTILCWAAFIAILGCMWPVGHRLDTTARRFVFYAHIPIIPSLCCWPKLAAVLPPPPTERSEVSIK